MKTKIVICWFRRDLRFEDNVALHHASLSGLPVLPLFIFDENIINQLPANDARVGFIHSTLEAMNEQLHKAGSSFLTKKGKPIEVWQNLLNDFEIDEVFFNKDYEPSTIKRDTEVAKMLTVNGIKVTACKDQVIFEEAQILKENGQPYTVFTPYKNRWLAKAATEIINTFPLPNFACFHKANFTWPSLSEIGFTKSEIVVPKFKLETIQNYDIYRDFPAKDATTYLGLYLRFGLVSIRELVGMAKAHNQTFLSELIWREFFKQILFHFPYVEQGCFYSKFDNIAWHNSEQNFEKWCQGRTGYYLVDAGMRQLNETGFMHNRIRMLVASFLCKHLLIDWRWGEAYFAQKLLDYDLSANNGNWQWAAGTGCDAAPYFRVFSPNRQIERFDKDFEYIKKWAPDYLSPYYPLPIVDHNMARTRAVEVYKKALSGY